MRQFRDVLRTRDAHVNDHLRSLAVVTDVLAANDVLGDDADTSTSFWSARAFAVSIRDAAAQTNRDKLATPMPNASS